MQTDLHESLERLYRRHHQGIKLGLEVEQKLLELMGNPEKNFKSIHVAGTNGKGSICAMLASILQAAGQKTGLYTSPHLIRFNERIRINGRAISNIQLSRLITKAEKFTDLVNQQCGREPTFFEITTALAFQYFADKCIDFAVLEVGMGGRLDATNVITPIVSVISHISMDHQQYLGDTIEKIAEEKAGIIKPEIPVVCGATDPRVLEVISSIAHSRKSPFIKADEVVSVNVLSNGVDGQKLKIEIADGTSFSVFLPLAGKYQLENVICVVATIYVLRNMDTIRINEKHIKKGISNVKWHGRFHMVCKDPPIILDGAHNPGAAEALAKTISEVAGTKPVSLILGMCSDKDISGFVKPLRNIVKKCWAVPIRSERSIQPTIIKNVVTPLGWNVSESSVPQALTEARTWAKHNSGIVCITGSLFLVGEVLEIMGFKI